jgi:DNA-binding LacI/PurR family transcriptional regulator
MAKNIGRPPKLIRRLVRQIQQDWVSGKEPNARLPTESALAAQYGAGRTSVRAALAHLEKAQKVYRLASRGIFVSGHWKRTQRDYEGRQIALLYCKHRFTYPMFDDFWVKVSFGIHSCVYTFGMNLLLISQPESHFWDDERTVLKHLQPPSVAGICVFGPQTEVVFSALESVALPAVALDFDATGKGFDSFCFDNRSAGVTLARRVYGLGHRRVAVVHESEDKPEERRDPAWDERHAGFAAEWCGRSLPGVLPLPVLERADVWPQIEDRLARALKGTSQEPPTAVVLPVACEPGRLRAGRAEFGARIPRDLTVVGYDTLRVLGERGPETSMTGVAFDATDLGRKAAVRLLHMIHSGRSRSSKPTLTRRKGRYFAGDTHARAPKPGPR